MTAGQAVTGVEEESPKSCTYCGTIRSDPRLLENSALCNAIFKGCL